MTAIEQKIEYNFPGKWTGGSHIHRSLSSKVYHCKEVTLRGVLKGMIETNVPTKLWSFLQHRFHNCEWLLSAHEFFAIMIQDVHGWLGGNGSSVTPKMLKNPATGNIFHRIALFGNIVCGIRFWAEDGKVYYRFRLEEQKEEDNKTRSTTRIHAEKALKALEQLIVELEIKEPTYVCEEEQKEKVFEYELL